MDILAITMWLGGRRGRAAVNGKVTYSKAAGRALEDWTQVLVQVNSLDPEKNAAIVGDSLVVHKKKKTQRNKERKKSSENYKLPLSSPKAVAFYFCPLDGAVTTERRHGWTHPISWMKKKRANYRQKKKKKCNYHSCPGTINAGGQKRHRANRLNGLLIWYNDIFFAGYKHI